MRKITTLRRFILTIIFGAILFIAGCESPEEAFNRGYQAGLEAGRANTESAREEGRQAGFKEGYEMARPTSGIAPPQGAWLTVSIVMMVFGMVKIILSLVVFTLFLIVMSESWQERIAKIITTSLAVILVFWLSNSLTLGFSRSIYDVILAPGANTALRKLATGSLAAVLMWAWLWILELLVTASKGHAYLQTLYVLLSSAIVTVLVPLFLSLQGVPSLFGYRFFDLILGIVIGGVSWIVQRLLIESENLRLVFAEQARRRAARENAASQSSVRRLRA